MPEGQIARRDPINRYHPDPEKSYTMPASHYIDPAIFEREKAAIFFRSWNYAGPAENLKQPGDYLTCRVVDQNIIVIRGKDGVLRGFYNVCSHRAHELLRGRGNAKVITCPYHAWSYRADGRLRTARGCDKVDGFNMDEFHLKEVRVDQMLGFVFVNLDPDAAPLANQIGDLANEIRRYVPEIEQLVHSHRLTYELKANWKNVVDNYLECYHCPPAHPAFSDLVDVKSYRTKTYGIYSSHIGSPGRAENTAYQIPDGELSEFGGWWLWPNLTLSSLPGPGNLALLHIMPTGPETTLEHLDFFFMNQEPSDCEQQAIKYFDEVLQPEDIGLVESVQRGLHSRGYHQGRFVVDRDRTSVSEHGVHHFHGLVLQALGG
ncbi:MAG: aromatic ring-hydroxylating oxygenase subunit alpha [Dongiaceae bacterium]